MSRKVENIIGIIGLLITLFTFLFGDNLYQQFIGHSFLDDISRPTQAIETILTPPTFQPPSATTPTSYPEISSNMIDEMGVTLVYVAEGEFAMGSTSEQIEEVFIDCQRQTNNQCSDDIPYTGYNNIFEDEKPQLRVYLDPYYIDQFEVSNALYAECVADSICHSPNDPSYTRESYYGNAKFYNYPVINVSWFDANTYCRWRNARLPSEAEWEKAASWNNLTQEKYVYPWGNNFDGSLANFCDINCLWDWTWQNKSYDDGYADTSPVGNYPNGVSPYGVYNMAGNVWEWVNDWYQSDYYATLGDDGYNPQGPSNGDRRVLRGGAFSNLNNNARTAYRDGYNPSNAVFSIGFRCARDMAR